MIALLAFACLLVVGALVSRLAAKTMLSVTVLFLGAGWLLGWIGALAPDPHAGAAPVVVQILLFVVLFAEASGLPERDLLGSWRRPSLALAIGLPLTAALIGLFAHLILGLSWSESFLLGAILSPTDPVFAQGLIGRESVPLGVRRVLGIESGLNDGLALPMVLVLIAVTTGGTISVASVVFGSLGGIAIGVAVPLVIRVTARVPGFGVSDDFRVVAVTATGVAIYTIAQLLHANPLLAAFAGGVTIASLTPDIAERFQRWSSPLVEIGKLGAVLVFGAVLASRFVDLSDGRAWLLGLAALILARPLALTVSLAWSGMPRLQWLSVAWFGPKGFSSIAYALLMLQSAVPSRVDLFGVAAIAITLSIVAHSTTDVPTARRLGAAERARDGVSRLRERGYPTRRSLPGRSP